MAVVIACAALCWGAMTEIAIGMSLTSSPRRQLSTRRCHPIQFTLNTTMSIVLLAAVVSV